MYMKIYETDANVMVAVCDKTIVGKTFREGELVLKLDECFYKGNEASDEEVKHAISCATVANIAGEKAIACAVDCGAIDPGTIIYIGGVPHAQMVQL
ncbi:MAG: DUF424 family protein [Candidatus Methanoperedens sp.]|nr:DUF424 family protein [Candidatus Methanoperedens sp.]PKL53796.1 MAG: DUF424 domain-containing protein [Candidatus Methanoperedenaceae archaeon HGW-Methanoperedenaceae-1]